MMHTTLYPTTPSRSSYSSPTSYAHIPLRSSPLASSPGSSPAAHASARRRTQYKSNPTSSSASQRVRDSEAQRRRASTARSLPEGSSSGAIPTEEAPRKAFLRERLKARCIERAVKKRERAVARGSRHLSSEGSSDGVDEMMDEDDEDEEVMLNDELFQRIVESAKRKQRHAYRMSYTYDVGSSFDPDIEDIKSWEDDLQAFEATSVTPDDLLDEELEAYAAEADLNLDDLPVDDIFSYSDFEDEGTSTAGEDVEMS
ncbi:hypothetical protein GY45DRAFT_1315557 [Cubamyces sp. BRFM 1775]|nr:hypothetical protein GY45DRAFT_1315557 [Cubamyces sp. BRFM 1775]